MTTLPESDDPSLVASPLISFCFEINCHVWNKEAWRLSGCSNPGLGSWWTTGPYAQWACQSWDEKGSYICYYSHQWRAPLSPFIFIVMQFLGKIMSNHRSAPPGNPGSATTHNGIFFSFFVQSRRSLVEGLIFYKFLLQKITQIWIHKGRGPIIFWIPYCWLV